MLANGCDVSLSQGRVSLARLDLFDKLESPSSTWVSFTNLALVHEVGSLLQAAVFFKMLSVFYKMYCPSQVKIIVKHLEFLSFVSFFIVNRFWATF